MRHYFSENHRKYSEAGQKEISEMAKTPLSAVEKEEQMTRNRQVSDARHQPMSRAQMKDLCGRIIKASEGEKE